MNKPLTLSQQQHMLSLIERVRAAQMALNSHIEYLRDEHSAPEHEGWAITDIQTGFERPEATPGKENT